MLTIDINNQFFALGENFSVRIVWENPACYTDEIPASTGMGINFPVNDINRALLQGTERFEKLTPGVTRFDNCTIRFGGAMIATGSLALIKASTDGFQCWLQPEIGVVGEKMKAKKITDFAWPVNQTFSNKTAYDDDTDHYGVIQIKNRGFWDGVGREVDNTITTDFGDRDQKISKLQKEHWDNFGWFVNKINTGTGVHISGNGCVVSPYLHLRYVLNEILRLNNFVVVKDEFTPTGGGEGLALQKNLMIYNNFNIMAASYTSIWQELPGWNPETQSVGDAGYNIITVTSWGISPFNYADLLPKIGLKEFFLGIQNTLNYIFLFHNNGSVDIIDREAIATGAAIDLEKYVANFWEMGEKKNTGIKFDPEVDKDDQFFGSYYEDLTDRLSDFGAPVANMAALNAISSPVVGELRLVTDINKIYEYKWMVASAENVDYTEEQVDTFSWQLVSTGTQPYIYEPGNEAREVIKVYATTLSKLEDIVPGYFTYTAVQKGNMAQMRSTWSDFTFRLMVANSFLWPNGMDWQGATGLFNTRWKNWAHIWANRQDVDGEFQMPLNALLYVARNITSKFRTNKGEFIIERMETEFGLNMIGDTKVNGYKV
jgi:hypothetical protein